MSVESTQRQLLVSPESPWLGLRSFNEDDTAFFFGRAEELDDLSERIFDKSLTILFGQSGLGKSSLLQAALIPRLWSRDLLPVYIRFDHDPSAPPLEQQLLKRLGDVLQAAGLNELARTIFTQLANPKPAIDHGAFLWMIFHHPSYGFVPARGSNTEGFVRPVFIVDQFEEMFTLGQRTERRAMSLAFRDSLAALVENRIPASLRTAIETNDDLAERLDYKVQATRVLLSLRDDFLHLLERWRRSIPSVMENRLELCMLTGPKAFEAVVRPGQHRPGKPPIISDDLGRLIVRFVAGASEDVPLEEINAVPPLLSLVCSELNAQRTLARAPQVTHAQFAGNSADILSSFYNRSFQAETYGSASTLLAPALGQTRRMIEDRLLSADGFRESIAYDTVARELSRAVSAEAAKVALDALVARRLLTVEERGGVRRIELTHDVLTKIAKASRDDRQEKEAIARAKANQEKAEAETARIRQERNRLRRLAILATSLAVAAAVGMIIGWMEYRRSVSATAAAVHARNDALAAKLEADHARSDAEQANALAQHRFDTAWASLTSLYDSYASDTLENTPGVSLKLATALRSKLRVHLLDQLYKLNREHPDHRGTLTYITRLLLDEGSDYNAPGIEDHSHALTALEEAMKWSQKIRIDTAEAAELRADILVGQSVARSYLVAKGDWNKFDDQVRPQVGTLHHQWPDSWRLQLSESLMECFLIFDQPKNRKKLEELDARMVGIMERSDFDFVVVNRHVWLMQLALWGEGNFDNTATDFEHERRVIGAFRQLVLGNKKYSLAQLEQSSARLKNILSFANSHLPGIKTAETADARRAVLNELESTVTGLEARLPKNLALYAIRGDLLRLQQACIPDGTNTRPARELAAAMERHRIIGAELGIGASVADMLSPAFKAYFSQNATAEEKRAAVATVEANLHSFSDLDLSGVDAVMNSSDIVIAGNHLGDGPDPLTQIYRQMLDRYIQLFIAGGPDVRLAYLDSCSTRTSEFFNEWERAGNDTRIISLWDSFRDLPIDSLTSGEKDGLVRILRVCCCALVRAGRIDDAKRLGTAVTNLCEAILAAAPWDWYLKDAYRGFCFDVAASLQKAGDASMVQPLLRRAWISVLMAEGREALIDKYTQWPLKGGIPETATGEERDYFKAFAPNGDPEHRFGMKRFTVPCDFNGVKYPFDVYILRGHNAIQEFRDQCRWLKERRGGTVPQEVVDSFEKLWKIAVDNKVDFCDLCVYALGEAAKEDKSPTTAASTRPTTSLGQ